MIPQVKQILDQIESIHSKKNEDYTSGGPFENFDRAAEVISWFKKDEDKAFVNHIATKLARLATLKSKDKGPNNESIADSHLDLAVYCILWYAKYLTDQSN